MIILTLSNTRAHMELGIVVLTLINTKQRKPGTADRLRRCAAPCLKRKAIHAAGWLHVGFEMGSFACFSHDWRPMAPSSESSSGLFQSHFEPLPALLQRSWHLAAPSSLQCHAANWWLAPAAAGCHARSQESLGSARKTSGDEGFADSQGACPSGQG